MKYRERFEIVALMLKSAANGISKTRLMYGTFVSYAQLGEYLNFLFANGLLEQTGHNRYKTTEKGLMFLLKYGALEKLLEA